MTAPDLTAQLAADLKDMWAGRHAESCTARVTVGDTWAHCKGDSTGCRYRKPAALVAYEQAQRADARLCPGCDASLAVCQEWRKNGAVACCPDCKHPLRASSEPMAHVTPEGDRWAALQPDRPCRVEGAGAQLPLGVIPRWRHNERRAADILNAMLRYVDAGTPIPREWLDELVEYVHDVPRVE